MGDRLELVTPSPEATRALGEAVASLLVPGDVVSLTGDLGAGKTTFVQGAAKGVGVSGPVLSPTFMLVREYEGRPPVYHLDVYRLERMQDVMDLGFDEMLEAAHIVFIEWGDAIEALLPENHLQVEITIPEDGGPGRRLALSGEGRSWALRWGRLEQVARRWRSG